MLLRRWHRWAAIPAGVFLLLIATTGILLHLDMMRVGLPPAGSEELAPPESTPLPSDEELAAMVVQLARAARGQDEIAVTSIQINLSGQRPTLVAGAGGPPGSPQIKLDAVTGEQIIDPPPPADYHYVLQNLHAGYSFGWTGRILSILCGISLIVLSVSGLQVWWDMRRRGRKGLYWK